MTDNQANSHNNLDEDSIDIIALLKTIWTGKKFVSKVTIVFFLIGCILALLSPIVYTSETTFVPQVSEDQMSSKSGLGSIASLAGINLNSANGSSESYLSPLLYSKLAESEEFSRDIIEEEISYLNGNKITIREYLQSNNNLFSFNPIGFIKKYTFGLFINNKQSEYNNETLKDYNFLSEEDFALVNSFKEKFIIELNEKDGYIKVIATDENAFISTQLVEKITKNLQFKIIKLRTNKIKERLEYSKELYELKQEEFDLLQKKLAEFKDSNKNISTARFMSELQKLESENRLQQNILLNLATEYNNNKIKLNKDTPIFSVIDEVSVPNEKSKPKRSFLITIFIFLGLVLSVGYILLKNQFINIIRKIKD
jgi:LPS O-antigen subunit length determinant protein (WzzB/FepE family)